MIDAKTWICWIVVGGCVEKREAPGMPGTGAHLSAVEAPSSFSSIALSIIPAVSMFAATPAATAPGSRKPSTVRTQTKLGIANELKIHTSGSAECETPCDAGGHAHPLVVT